MSEHGFVDTFKIQHPGFIDVTGGVCPLLDTQNKCMVHDAKPRHCSITNPCEVKNGQTES